MLDELTKKIVEVFHPRKILLFGSCAWGNATKDSDFDLFIIMDTNEKRYSKRVINILSKCHPGNISIDLLVRTPQEVEECLKIGDPLIKKVIEQGKVLYDTTSR